MDAIYAGLVGILLTATSLFGFSQYQEQTFGATPALTVPQGGTGTSTFTGGKLVAGSSALRLTEVSTTSVSCSGDASCTSFTVIGNSPVTISAVGGSGSGFSTTSADYWKSVRNFFSTTSAAYFTSVGLSWSTTSADFWETQQTARTADDLTNNQIDDLSDVAALSETLGDVLSWNGSSWIDVATSTLGLESPLTFSSPLSRTGNVISFLFDTANTWTGHNIFSSLFATNSSSTNATTTNLTITSLASQLLRTDSGGVVRGVTIGSNLSFDGTTLSATGGGGSGGGTWSTTTSQVSGTLVNYPNNTTDVVAIGSNSTTTAEFYLDPNTLRAQFGATGATGGSLTVGTSTVLATIGAWGSGNNIFRILNTASTTVLRATDYGATTTNLTVEGAASSTSLTVSGLNAASCDVKASTAGVLSCGTDATGAGGTPDSKWATSTDFAIYPSGVTNSLIVGTTNQLGNDCLICSFATSSTGTLIFASSSSPYSNGNYHFYSTHNSLDSFYTTAGGDLFLRDDATFGGDLTINSLGGGSTLLISGSASTLQVGTAGVTLTDDGDGALTITSFGDTNNENLTVNLDDTADTAVWSSSTGVDNINWSAISTTTFTNLVALTNASTTRLVVSNLNSASCDVKASTSGVLSCGTDATGAGGSGLSTTTPISDSNVLVYSSSGSGSAYGVATGTVSSANTALTVTAGRSVIGGALTLTVSTTTTTMFSGSGGSILAYSNALGGWFPQATSTMNVGTASALFADPTDCSAGSFPLGINAAGTAQSCTDAWTEAENTAAAYAAQATTITVAGTAQQITSSAGAQSLAANRTWTLSLPSYVLFPGDFRATEATTTRFTTTNATATNATTTNFYISGAFNLFGTVYTTLAALGNALVNAVTAVTPTGTWDFGGATSLEIVNGTNPTVDAIGEIALDTTANQLLIGTTTNASFPATFPLEQPLFSVTIGSTTPEFVGSNGQIPISRWVGKAREVTRVECYVTGGTSKVVNITDGTNDTETTTCGTTNTQDNSLDTNSSFTASELWYVELGATTGAVNYVTYTAYGYVSRE